ncbi:MAG: FAD-dependent oxidoreductase [Steroidobacteraceae bacterium]|jgi:NAD(P) transhydrogenase
MDGVEVFDLVCLGSGPAGQKAAVQAARAGFRAAVIEREERLGGLGLLSGAIPTKILREQALRYRRMHGSVTSLAVKLHGDAPLSALLYGVEDVVGAQDRCVRAEYERNGVELIHGRAALRDAHRVDVQKSDGTHSSLHASRIIIATGSSPRRHERIKVDHERLLDSDSILHMPYIPRSLAVLGSGVIACEYASIFAALGCKVTIADLAPEPLGLLDPVLRAGFRSGFESMGGRYLGGVEVESAAFDGYSQVDVQLRSGDILRADVVLCAFGRIASVDGLGLDRLGLILTPRGYVQVDARLRTNVQGVFAAGDVIGPPSLAAAAADQGRRAALSAFGLDYPANIDPVPLAVYTIPEIACAGLTQTAAARANTDVIVGRAEFDDVARAHIAGDPAGFLTLICERASARVLGVQAVGEGAAELVHLGQSAIARAATAEFFIAQMFNFPSMTEAYRIAALDVMRQRAGRSKIQESTSS